ncbi:MAG: DEAD/DEAH box helicase [Candidatus Woesearchaeota archaeon]
MNFKELGIKGTVLTSLEKHGFDTPTTVQEMSIPPTLAGKDVIAQSATGSGKTLAFAAGIIQNIKKGKGIKALVVTPTRELANQVMDSLIDFSMKKLHVTSVYGGVSIGPQMDALRKADVVVGTPGRLLDHLERGTIDLSNVDFLVLDEADRMLDMGFIDDVKKIMKQCPKERQTFLFSATMPPEIRRLAKQFTNNPEYITAEQYVLPENLPQVYYDVKNHRKLSLLVHLIKQEDNSLVMVFCNSKVTTDLVASTLRKEKIDAIEIHGGLTQQKRDTVIKKFNTNKATVLVCTDVAARGLDIPDVSHIYNYDIPGDSKQYVHRIGRTARAGKSGKVINLLTPRDHDNFGRVLKDNDFEIEKLDTPSFATVEVKRPASGRDSGRSSGYRGGSRGSSGPRGGPGSRPRGSQGPRGGPGSRGGRGGPGSSGSRGSDPRSKGGRDSKDSGRGKPRKGNFRDGPKWAQR